jgi:2'-hydroxyisoflavone reductase
MDILIVGGTRFLGRALVESALEYGHQVTLFNRGNSNPEWFPHLEKLIGDRNQDLSILAGHKWQSVIDTCAYYPRQVSHLLGALKGTIEHYTLISSISVYTDFSQPGLIETSPLATIQDNTTEEITGETYGPLKGLCESTAQQNLPGQALIVRPGLIVGPFDPSDRFTYWPVRVARGGEILCPDSPEWYTQIIDVRDLAEWIIHLVEKNVTGIFNATGPDYPLKFGEILETSRAITASNARFNWVDTQYLLNNEIEPWSDLPLWLPGPENAGANQVNIQSALLTGLTFRPLATTIRDTLNWESTRPSDHTWRAGLSPEKELELLWSIGSAKS